MNRCSIENLSMKIKQYSPGNVCVGVCYLIKIRSSVLQFYLKKTQQGVFLVNIAKFLRTPVLKNIWERLFERFPAWKNNITSNIGSEEDIFSKAQQKNHFMTQLDEKKLGFSWCSWSFHFSLYLYWMSGVVCST